MGAAGGGIRGPAEPDPRPQPGRAIGGRGASRRGAGGGVSHPQHASNQPHLARFCSQVVGLGTGSTAAFAVDRIGELLKNGTLKDIVGVPTSIRTYEQVRGWGSALSGA